MVTKREDVLMDSNTDIGKALRELSIRLRDESGHIRCISDLLCDLADEWSEVDRYEQMGDASDSDYKNRRVHCLDCEHSHVIRSDYDIVSCAKGRQATCFGAHKCREYILASIAEENCNTCECLDAIHGNDGEIGITNFECSKFEGKHSLKRCENYSRLMHVDYCN